MLLVVGCSTPKQQPQTMMLASKKPPGTVYVVGVPSSGGHTSGGGSYPAQSYIQISAVPNSGWSLRSWNDGNTQLTRTVQVPTPNSSVTYTATFQQNPVTSPILITVGWDVIVQASSYFVYQGRASGSYTNRTSVVPNKLQIQVWPGTTYIAATSIDSHGTESTNYSNEITYTY
jgi:hypothetical protein